jgi:hypothetical protein
MIPRLAITQNTADLRLRAVALFVKVNAYGIGR